MNYLSRRQLLEAVGGSFAISSLAGCTEDGSSADGTTQTTETTNRTTAATTTETTTEETTQAPEDVPPPESFRWRQPIEDMFGPSVVTNEIAYFSGGSVYAFSTATGAVRWKHDVKQGTEGWPILKNETFYVVSGSSRCGVVEDYVCHALDATSGEQRWTFTPQRDEKPSEHDEGRLRLLGVTTDTVYVEEEYQDDWKTVYALNRDGSIRWRKRVSRSSWATVDEKGIYLDSPRLYARDHETGSVRWRSDEGYSISTMVNGTLYANHRSGLAAVDATDGSVQWRAATPNDYHSLTYDGTVVYAIDSKLLFAFDATTGREKWRYDDDYYLKTAVSDGRSVYVGSENGMVALDKTDGSLRWTFGRQPDRERNMYLNADDIGVGNAIYVSIEEAIYCLTSDGKPQWRLGQAAFAPFTVANGAIYGAVSDKNPGEQKAFAIDTPEVTTMSETAGKMTTSDGIVYSDGRTAHAKPQSMIPALGGSCFGGK